MRTWIRRLLTGPVFEDEEKTRTARLLNAVLLTLLAAATLILVAIPLMAGLPLSGTSAFTWLIGLVVLVALLGLWLLMQRGQVRTASVILVSLVWLVATVWIGGIAGIASDSSLLLYALVIVLGGLLLGGRATMWITLVSVLAIGGAYYAETSGWTSPAHEKAEISDLLFSAAPVIVIGLLLRYTVNSLVNALHIAWQNERAQIAANRELQAIRATLEQRVAARTYDLERRTRQLRAANAVSRIVSSSLDTAELIHLVVHTVREQFALRHAGLFLVDETGTRATLQAAAGEADLASGTSTQLGERLVGESLARHQAQVAPIGPPGEGAIAAFPLRSRGRALGVLTLLSDRADAFDESAVTVLETLADQIAESLDNTRLFAESQAALEAARRAYGELSREAWLELLRPRAGRGYRYALRTVAPLADDWPPEMVQAVQTGQRVLGDTTGEPTVAIPIKVRDEVVGALGFYKDMAGEMWTSEEVSLLETLADQLGIALESARLYQDTQRRAAQERLIGEITERLRASLDPDTILKTTVQELGQVLGAKRVSVELTSPAISPGEPRPAMGKEA